MAPHLQPILAESLQTTEAHSNHSHCLGPQISRTNLQISHTHLNPDAASFTPHSSVIDEQSVLDHSLLDYEDDLWEHLLESNTRDSPKPGPCACHKLSLCSCPSTIKDIINLIQMHEGTITNQKL